MILEKTESFSQEILIIINAWTLKQKMTYGEPAWTTRDAHRSVVICSGVKPELFPSSKDHNPSALKSIGEKIVTAYEPSGLSEPKSEWHYFIFSFCWSDGVSVISAWFFTPFFAPFFNLSLQWLPFTLFKLIQKLTFINPLSTSLLVDPMQTHLSRVQHQP